MECLLWVRQYIKHGDNTWNMTIIAPSFMKLLSVANTKVIQLNELMNGSIKKVNIQVLYTSIITAFYIWILHILVRVLTRNFMMCMLLLFREFFLLSHLFLIGILIFFLVFHGLNDFCLRGFYVAFLSFLRILCNY